jgi:predicted Zn-dependent protease
MALLTGLCVVIFHSASPALPPVPRPSDLAAPAAQVHPLPAPLSAWQDPGQHGDYFDQIEPARAGYLVWSQFPIQVYVGTATASGPQADQIWQAAVATALQDWQPYLPLVLTDQPTLANITLEQVSPRYQTSSRVRSAETRHQIYVDDHKVLTHRCTIIIRPNQTERYLAAAVRHELGHALGLWGHSPESTDVMYFSQVRTPAMVSVRDVNTLKRVYEQPTRLGWPLSSPSGTIH